MKTQFGHALLLLLAATFATRLLAASPTGTSARPNILWVVAEDYTANYAGPYGDPLARTPNIDRLARDGIVFEKAYSTSAVCAPTRASIITGMFAPSLGTQHMRSNVPLPAWLLRGLLTVLHPLGVVQYGPEQVMFLQYRPVLSNARLKRDFAYTPRYTSLEALDALLEAQPMLKGAR